MQNAKFNIVVDGQFGSCGKGLISTYLVHRYNIKNVSTTNMANAGHTAVNIDGSKHIGKALPAAAILRNWYPTIFGNMFVHIGPTAGFTVAQFHKESVQTLTPAPWLRVHPRAGVINERHARWESSDIDPASTKHIASTMQGCGAMLAEKILRGAQVRLAENYSELDSYVVSNFVHFIHSAMNEGATFLHEGAQGFSLGINHGHSYPYCTSRECTAMQIAADMGIPHQLIGDVIMVIRPYPIRVGNVVENGKQVGYSGDWYPDQEEITWEQIGVPPEITTVTGRMRRVATFSWQELKVAARINGATQIAVNFANYLDPLCYGIKDVEALSPRIVEFCSKVQTSTGVPVRYIGTGPRICDVCYNDGSRF